ncbi:MAG: hypothetical protein EZS28_021959 [Streblomastix strix]|uniref:Tyr recombinase domain-containing protein n=1 Tax=Streblomastix strix TaxID=222440 RepID=A0A5J4VJ97_9EUKA|nr:MAG: hypothetical protein EZS28_021959 [Streblomastix strix]
MPQIDIFAIQNNKPINNYATVDLNDLIKQSITENEVGQSTRNNFGQDSGDGIENERQGSKTSTRQCGRLPSGPVADVERDLLIRFINMRGFSENGVKLLFNGQRFNTIKRDFTPLHYYRIVASAKSHKACLTTMLSLIYKENLACSTASKLINKALTNAAKPHRRYQNIWNIQILFNNWRQSKQNKYLNNYDLQVKIASLLMSICIFRPNEIAEIRLKFLNVNQRENQASLRLAPKQANAIEPYEVYETDNEKISPKLEIQEWIDRLKKQFPKDISLQLTKQLREQKIVGASAFSIQHSATTKLAKLGISKRDIATRRIKERKGQPIIILVSLGDGVTIRYTRISFTHHCPPKICIPTRGEREISRKFPRELNDQTSGMMLKVGWSAWNDNDFIRTLLYQSLISLIQRIIDKEMLPTSCIDEYEEEIDE